MRTFSLVAATATLAACSSSPNRVTQVPVPEVQAAAAEPDSPEKLARLIAAGAGAEVIDRVAGQRYASVSHLFWYRDLEEAKRAARAAGKPILSLRMLGRLDEDRSCANSRFFRVALYANKDLSKWLRDSFILHWSSERPVPKLTIDMGDGRTIETTVAGNSAHYVLDADGRVLDVIPGLMTPKAFRHELEGALTVFEDPSQLASYHAAHAAAIDAEWTKLAALKIPDETYEQSLAAAERLTVSKMMVEIPAVKYARLGDAPSDLAVDSNAWENIGYQLLSMRSLDTAEVLDVQSRGLLARLAPVDWDHPERTLDAEQLGALIRSFEAAIVGDTGLNLLRLRREVHLRLADTPMTDFASVNEWVYSALFRTPAYDRWLGLATRGTFTGLPTDGVALRE
jgi:hypothetical protein